LTVETAGIDPVVQLSIFLIGWVHQTHPDLKSPDTRQA